MERVVFKYSIHPTLHLTKIPQMRPTNYLSRNSFMDTNTNYKYLDTLALNAKIN